MEGPGKGKGTYLPPVAEEREGHGEGKGSWGKGLIRPEVSVRRCAVLVCSYGSRGPSNFVLQKMQ